MGHRVHIICNSIMGYVCRIMPISKSALLEQLFHKCNRRIHCKYNSGLYTKPNSGFIPVAGWIGAAVVGYCATLFSGCAYLEVLASLHKREKVKERFNTNKAITSINKNK